MSTETTTETRTLRTVFDGSDIDPELARATLATIELGARCVGWEGYALRHFIETDFLDTPAEIFDAFWNAPETIAARAAREEAAERVS